jgi:hypothetical protein
MNPSPVSSPIPVIEDSERRLAKMRRQLEDMFRSLDLVHDEVSVLSEAARSEGQPEIANVLSLSVCNRLFGQLKLLTSIIERVLSARLLDGPQADPVRVRHGRSTSYVRRWRPGGVGGHR